jgi:hypothetical protein
MNTHKWQEIWDTMGLERCSNIDARVEAALAEMPLIELHQARGLSQKMLADKCDFYLLRICQTAIHEIAAMLNRTTVKKSCINISTPYDPLDKQVNGTNKPLIVASPATV